MRKGFSLVIVLVVLLLIGLFTGGVTYFVASQGRGQGYSTEASAEESPAPSDISDSVDPKIIEDEITKSAPDLPTSDYAAIDRDAASL